jgi:hypothetical protein
MGAMVGDMLNDNDNDKATEYHPDPLIIDIDTTSHHNNDTIISDNFS